jgi:hypothetical protein
MARPTMVRREADRQSKMVSTAEESEALPVKIKRSSQRFSCVEEY